MDASHRIDIRGNSLIINEMYFRIDEIRFVDVVQQNYPLIRQLLLVGTAGCALIGLPLLAASPDFGIPVLLLGAIEAVIACSIKRRYALRVGECMGTSKVVISTDRKELESLRQRICEAMERRAEQ